MLTIQNPPYRVCDGMSRREWLRVGSLGVFGLSMPTLLQARPARTVAPGSVGRAKSCIVLWLFGGPPQHETWDPKPDAVEEVRGEFNSIATNVPGVRVNELMPRLARQADKYCILRAVSTNDSTHGGGQYAMRTGQRYQLVNGEDVLGPPNDFPSFAGIVRATRQRPGELPAAITLPQRVSPAGNENPGESAGFLGRASDPWTLLCDPSAADFQINEVALPGDIAPLRFDNRLRLLKQVAGHLNSVDRSGAPARFDTVQQQAFELLRTPRAREAFDLTREPAAVRDRYGRHRFGQSVLLARRLVEAGVPLVQVNWPWKNDDALGVSTMWDTHQKQTVRLKTILMPPWDQAFSALLEDLSARGLLDQTLVVCTGEMGRTPKMNRKAVPGRDHWGDVLSVALAGGGVRGGQVYGASDSMGAQPKDGRVGPADLTATIFHCLGLEPDTEIRDRLGRNVPISRGEVVRQLF